jgi:CheY-like chemotaxis protein
MSDIRVVLADDHPVVRAGLAALLGSLQGIEVVGVAADGREAVREVVLQRPNVAVLDLQMPGQDGFAATREIARVAPEVAVLVLTMFDDDDSVFCSDAGRGSRLCRQGRRAGGDRSGDPSGRLWGGDLRTWHRAAGAALLR